MKIVMFSINPIFPELITGGASKHLFNIAKAVGDAGHDVHILCAQPQNAQPSFDWAENVRVSQNLPFHLPFPQPYAISGADLGLILERIAAELETADRFYIHDGEFLVPDVYADIPTVTSFRDNIYPESVLGTFVGKADEVICVSPYSTAVVKYSAGRYFPGLNDRIHHVNNGIDFTTFKPVDAQALAGELGIDPEVDQVLLHPHRPEPGKGLPETVQVVAKLVHQHGMTHLKALIPEWIVSMVSTSESIFYQGMLRLMDELGVREHFVFIPWMPQRRMPELYSLGDATLCLGNFVEAFGNVAYESIACGTPSVAARVGVHRTLMPDDLIHKVNYGDIDHAVESVLDILNGEHSHQAQSLDYLKRTMDIERQVTSYREIITRCEKREGLAYSVPNYTEEHPYILAPWCYYDGDRIFHDFHGTYTRDQHLTDLLRENSRISRAQAAQVGIQEAQWHTWLDRTWLVPVELEHE